MLPEIVVNVVDRPVPTAVKAVIITTAIKAAISPYSIAVAPASSRAKHLMRIDTLSSMNLSVDPLRPLWRDARLMVKHCPNFMVLQ